MWSIIESIGAVLNPSCYTSRRGSDASIHGPSESAPSESFNGNLGHAGAAGSLSRTGSVRTYCSRGSGSTFCDVDDPCAYQGNGTVDLYYGAMSAEEQYWDPACRARVLSLIANQRGWSTEKKEMAAQLWNLHDSKRNGKNNSWRTADKELLILAEA